MSIGKYEEVKLGSDQRTSLNKLKAKSMIKGHLWATLYDKLVGFLLQQ